MLVKGKKHTSIGTFRGNLYAKSGIEDVKKDCDENMGTKRKGLMAAATKRQLATKRR
jgi:hypothetical protein